MTASGALPALDHPVYQQPFPEASVLAMSTDELFLPWRGSTNRFQESVNP